MKSHVRLNLYERGIINAMVTIFKVDPAAARELVVDYVHVIRKLGGYDNVEVHAERLIEAKRIGFTAEAWLERIQSLRREALNDPGIETQHEVAHVH